MAALRVYVVYQKTSDTTTEVNLIRAKNRAAAENFLARATIKAELAGQDELIELVRAGMKVQDVTE